MCLWVPEPSNIHNVLEDKFVGLQPVQCCQLSDFVDFSDPFSDFKKKKAPSDKSSDFWKNLSHFPNVASTVLRAQDLELHLSLCLLWSVSAKKTTI